MTLTRQTFELFHLNFKIILKKFGSSHMDASTKCPPPSSRTVSPEAWSAGKQPCRARSNHHYSYATRFKPSRRPRRHLYKCTTQPLWLCIYASLICKSPTPTYVCSGAGKFKYHIWDCRILQYFCIVAKPTNESKLYLLKMLTKYWDVQFWNSILW